MKQFINQYFIIESDSEYWYNVGFKINTDDDRLIKIKPVHAIKQLDNKWKIQMNAEIILEHLPKVSKENVLNLSKKESGYLNNALRTYSNLISVTDFCKVQISSPTPSSGFIPENKEELDFLNATKGIEHTLIAQPNFSGKFFDSIHKDPLLDRKHGVSFLASVNSQNEFIGKFRDCIRLFENAFSATTQTLANLLFEFLSSNKQFDYTLDEITEWMVDNRHSATHTDQRSTFIFSSDLGGSMPRIMQAAYDVLFSKKIWHDNSTERRNNLEFQSGITKTGMFIIGGKKEGISIRIGDEDEDGEFFHPETDIEEILSEKFELPENWRIKYSNTDGSKFVTQKFSFDVRKS